MKQWYQELFSNYAEKYESECYTHGTQGEVNFIEKELNYNKNAKILDIGCGTGRHSIELTKRGYSVVGMDLSESMLNKARENAENEGLKLDLRQADARNLLFEEEFDLVIMICEGGFSLMETDEMNFQILENAAKALKKNGKLIFTTLNGLFPLFHSVKDFINSNSENQVNMDNNFDLMTFRDHNTMEIEGDDGEIMVLDCNERYYVPSEITWLLKSLNFTKIEIFGCKLGEFSRKDSLTTEDYEMLVVGEL
ncbi:class I SAM-dependent methyltransferase [Methanobacterium alcaliphilum]|uniref:class I SAM-dependent methyltransferase n=1 Tax=Methanobacterium alcaliphilum TaxID=392018 RepID=UPI00200A86CE|nr:class I SAM-dependent methyltransferase [Methanobacterium alcaliphilum]MCK9151403.1 class I SAM-dependent methyltransferase [Methanobacterium alcaliphilum]